MTCKYCLDTGVIETGNNDLPCFCPAGDKAQFNISEVEGRSVTGAEVKAHFLNNSPDPLTALVVDDDRDMRLHVIRELRREGFHPMEAANGKEGLQMYRKYGPFTVVVTDWSMPELLGCQLVARIRDLEPTQRIVMISSEPLMAKGNLKDAEVVGVPVLCKPLDDGEVMNAVREMA
jgi:PleD family two-component response regulator